MLSSFKRAILEATGERQRLLTKIWINRCLLQVCPNVIRWNDGRTETVTDRKLDKLQEQHPNWMADF